MNKLGPLVADSYVMQAVGKYVRTVCRQVESEAQRQVFDKLDLVHHYTSGFKSLFTSTALAGIDTCRQACGGVGYSQHSGLPEAWANYAPVTILEGENTVMAQQSARYLLKQANLARRKQKL